MGQLAHFISLGLSPSLKEREGLDRSVTFNSLTFSLNTRAFSLTPRRERDGTRRSLRFNSIPPLSRRERDGTAQSHSVPSPPFGLRPEAVILDRAVFASLSRGQSNPLFSSTHCFKEKEGVDDKLTSFRMSPSGLRPEAVISKPAPFAPLSRVLSNPLRGFSSTHYFT